MVVQVEAEIDELVGRMSARVGGKKIVVERRIPRRDAKSKALMLLLFLC
jgi:hypothetical protein